MTQPTSLDTSKRFQVRDTDSLHLFARLGLLNMMRSKVQVIFVWLELDGGLLTKHGDGGSQARCY